MGNEKKDTFRFLKPRKIGLILLIFLGIYLISFSVYPHLGWSYYFGLSPLKIGFDIVSTLLLSFFIIELFLMIDRKMNSQLHWHIYTVRRWVIQTCVQTLSLLVMLVVYAYLTLKTMELLGISYASEESAESDLGNLLVSIIFLSLIVSMLNTVTFLSSNWRKEIIAAAEYKTKAAESQQLVTQSELHALRLQLDTHFVFNNLSVLSELILIDQQLGFQYSENFAKVYRYLLINAKKQVITLNDEINFLKSYLFLLENRMGKGVEFRVGIQESHLHLHLPPITLQLLVENAMKHNRIDKESPLLIKIYTDHTDHLIVENDIKPLLKSPVSAGVGLEQTKKYSS